MYCVIFEYKNGKKGICINEGKPAFFDTEKEASCFAENLNSSIDEKVKDFFPKWSAVKVETISKEQRTNAESVKV